MAGIVDLARQAVRDEAAKGARDAMMPWVLLALALSLYAVNRKARR